MVHLGGLMGVQSKLSLLNRQYKSIFSLVTNALNPAI